MARNICDTVCQFCGHDVVLTEEPRKITEKDCGRYITDYSGILVANAECPICLSKYLAWVTDGVLRRHAGYGGFVDLSYRSTFNDEPGEDDLPIYDVQVIYHRVAKYDKYGR